MSIILHEGCCLEELEKVADKSIQLVCIDPPYNINKDTWDNIDNYVEWLTSVIVLLETKMKNSGSLFVFHNEMETIAELILSIRTNSKLKLKQMITWNKRFNESRQKGYLDGYVVKNDMHMFNKMCEYILFYTFDNHELIRATRKEKNIAPTTISSEILSRTGGMTGWYSNIETGKNYPTRETMKPITKHLGLEYDDVVPKFKNQKTHHSVWDFDMAKRNKVHITPKPINLLENIIRHTTDEGDLLLDCFAGSGSLGMAAKNTNRNCILIEKEAKYCAFIRSEMKLEVL
jgi:site-specific DNA-methyltransferase (adenine-specific)